ncbi:ECF transporter S component, partial [Gemella sp. GH3]|uniref:ECF transporter S component n=1 Tax=unclassified Gemella TaxID=2624949 RepID=UPI0015D0590B
MYKNTHSIILSALLAVLSLILSLIAVAVPFLPPFLKLDLSMIPLFIGFLILGYKETIVISILKNFLHFLLISHEPTGSIANIIVEIIFISCLSVFYKKELYKFIIGSIVATIAITLAMSVMNYYVLLPMYGYIINLSDLTNNLKLLVTYGIIPVSYKHLTLPTNSRV